ncbi:MAG TPA: alpha,alpha-trehalase TreF [Candidatus Saccharibacteria bacterium]|nr:alpha,alpha-trehalase TreF [Candidatus Saccharibacteria bacterium]HRQ98023.1 alpha,alpha-trehalase TreF [Candidatus Saccharibacteria bacterium]
MIEKINTDKIKSSLVSTAGQLIRATKGPDEMLGELFADVQNNRIYTDGKTFADLIPRRRIKQIQQEYLLQKEDPDFDLRDFISRHFYALHTDKLTTYKTDMSMTSREHIIELWDELEHKNRRDRGSLIALPYSYIVPGGRFSEQFYWDSYFIMLGLAADDKWDMVENMVKNCAYMIRKFGFVPTANRTYFTSRSQPPFFSRMVRLLAGHKGQSVLVEYLPYMVLEHRFWMKGRTKLTKAEHKAFARVAEMPDGSLLNRYYDNKTTPRPESLHEDTETALSAKRRQSDRLYLHLRAGAESGWDFSSRWLIDPDDLRTIHTADIIPIDLNCLIYELEVTIVKAYHISKNPVLARTFQAMADRRVYAINKYCWSDKEQFFVDYNFHKKRSTGRVTLAAVFPLYAKIATSKQASAVADRLKQDFLKDGGLVTTLIDTGQQWDSPNGWAPLQWVAIEGLRNYGYYQLADEIKERWMAINDKLLSSKGKLVEKYNVVDTNKAGGGGEYPLQDGFGWTNGVLARLLNESS